MTVELNLSILYVMFCFLLIFLVAKKYLFLPLEKILDEREEMIESARKLSTGSDSVIEQKMAAYNHKISMARVDALTTRQTYKIKGENFQNETLEEARTQVAKMLEDADEQLQKSVNDARSSLEADSESLAASIAAAIIGRRV